METELPVEVMKKALGLRNAMRGIFLALYRHGEPATSVEIAGMVKHARAYVNMRLIQLEELGLVREVEGEGRAKHYEVII